MGQVETIYGDCIVSAHLRELDGYAMITDPKVWEVYRDEVKPKPTIILFPETLERRRLDEMATGIPDHLEIVGMGGGAVVDEVKYLACLKGKTPTLVPTITSSNAPWSDAISVRDNGVPVGMVKEDYPRRIMIDYRLIRQADPRLNRAGYGDLLYFQTTWKDWELVSAHNKEIAYHEGVSEEVSEKVSEILEHAELIGSLSDEGIHRIVRFFEQTTELIKKHRAYPLAAGSEHLFAWNLERVSGRHFIHGEIVALGTLISANLQNCRAAELRAALDKAGVIYHPHQLDISWEEIAETLTTVETYNREVRHFHTVYETLEWTPGLLNEVREWIYQ